VNDRRELTVAFELVAPAFRATRHHGHPDAAVWAAASLERPPGWRPGARIAVDDAHALWTSAVRVTGDGGLGLVAAARGKQGDMDLLDYVLRGSPTLRVGFEKVGRFWRLAHDCGSLELRTERHRLVCEFQVEGGLEVPPAFTEWGVASWARTTRELFGPLRYREVRFRHAQQTKMERYRTFFGCEPRFLASKDALVMSVDVLDHPNPSADARLVEVLERYAEARLREIPERPMLSARVKVLLREALPHGDIGIPAIARRLKMSERTLRRRLDAERTGHRELLDAVRRELALRHLGEEGLSVEDAAFRVGFDSPSGLHRAFKRWTGFSPIEYRSRFGAASRG
jgi:AraC-like DNA-binding protein